MATEPQTTATQSKPAKAKSQAVGSLAAGAALAVKSNLRRKSRAEHRKKMAAKIRSDKEFAKTYFDAKSKRATDKKVAFRKKKSRKK